MTEIKKSNLRDKSILFVFCSLELGGAERQGMHLARYLKGLGCDVRVLATHGKPGLVIDQCHDANIPWSVQRFQWPCRKISLIRDSWGIVKALRRVRPEIILGYTRWANVGCGLTWRWSTAGIFIWGQRGVNSLFGDAIERRAYHRASAVICNAEHEVEYLHRTLGKAAGPVYVVHNGVQLEPCQKSRGEWRRELGIHKDAIVATMVANFGHYKDHPTLLRAWRSAIESQSERKNGYRLLIAGFPHSIVCFEAAKRLIIELEIEDWVIILGQVRDVSGLLAASDIGVLASGTAKIDGLSAFSQPSFAQEGLSNSVLEYMASGLPVIATDLPGNREALGDNPIQPLFKLGNSEGLAARLKSLLNDPGLRRELGEMNKQRALTKFSVESMCGKSAGIITDLLSSQSSNIQKPRTKE